MFFHINIFLFENSAQEFWACLFVFSDVINLEFCDEELRHYRLEETLTEIKIRLYLESCKLIGI